MRPSDVRRAGYTSVEILTVVAIVTIVAAILFPTYGFVRNRAWHTTCADNLHQLGEAEHLYANDHDGWVPPATTAETFYLQSTHITVTADEVLASPAVLRVALDPYVKSDQVWFCPTDPYARQNTLWLGQRHLLTSYWFFPRDDSFPVWPPRMQLMRDRLSNAPPNAEDVPLICDATGEPKFDPGANPNDGNPHALSNHPDSTVNIIRHDLSLTRKSADYMNGVQP